MIAEPECLDHAWLATMQRQNADMRTALELVKEQELLVERCVSAGVLPYAIPATQTMATLALVVANKHGLTVQELRGPSRCRSITWARHEAMALMRSVTRPSGRPRYSLPQIGAFFGRDHTTVLHGIRRHLWKEAL